MTDDLRVRFGFLDRVFSGLSPKRAAQRYAARITLANMRRSYDGAAKGRSTSGWTTTGASADTEITAAGGILRDRMRDLVRNDPLAAQAVQVLVNNIVGPGIRPRARTGNKRLDKRVDELWQGFARACDWHGHTDFHGLLTLAVREMVEGGEVLAVQRFQRRGDGRAVPLRIELREGDHLDDSRASFGAGSARITQGIEYDAEGRRVAYWMFPDHPGGTANAFSRRHQSERVPADQVAHLFERQRVQSRGVPWGVAAMRGLRDFGDWHRSELMRKKTEAALVGFVISDDVEAGGIGAASDQDGKRVESFEPGMIAYLDGTKDVRFNQPASVGGVGEWSRTQMHIIAAGFRVPYALMSGDLSQANFSSTRAGLNEFRRMVEQIQWQVVIPMFCQPIWDWFVLAARTQGLLTDDGRDIGVEWAPPKFESVNPLQDANADVIEVRAGFATRSQKIAARGYDPAEVMQEWVQDAAAADTGGLIFDSDPRKVAKAGTYQPEPGGGADDHAGTPGDRTE